MGKIAIGVLAFVAGGIVGVVATRQYFKAHALELTTTGILDKFFGEGSKAGVVGGGVASIIEGIGNS